MSKARVLMQDINDCNLSRAKTYDSGKQIWTLDLKFVGRHESKYELSWFHLILRYS